MSIDLRPIPGYESLYLIGDAGAIYSLHPRSNGKRLRTGVMDTGHHRVDLSRNGEHRSFLVHRLVLEAFVGPCPEGLEGCHNNGNPADNRVENLRWDSRSSNRFDAVRHGSDPNASKAECLRGHPFDAANTYRHSGRRHCRACRATQKRRRELVLIDGGIA